jgi:tetratricopeptide (TPR) repeat protein
METATTVPQRKSSSVESHLDRLPMPVALEKAEIWLDEHELKAFRNIPKVRLQIAMAPLIFLLPMLFLDVALSTHFSMAWRLLFTAGLAWSFASLAVPLICGYRAFSLLEAGDPKRALKVAEASAVAVRYLGPMAAIYHSFFLEQVRAIAFAMQGRIVDAQVMLVQWVYCPEKMLSDSLMQTTFGALYSYVGRVDLAEKIYSARYEASKSKFTSKNAKAVAAANMGWARFLTRDYESSKELSYEALSYVSKLNQDEWVWIKIGVWTNLARTCIRLDQISEAEKLVSDAWDLFAQQTRHPGIRAGEINLTFAELRFVQGRFEEALLYANSATECYQSSLAPGNASVVYAMRLKAEILRALGNIEESDYIIAQSEIDEHTLREDNENRLDDLRMQLLSGPNGLLLPNVQSG